MKEYEVYIQFESQTVLVKAISAKEARSKALKKTYKRKIKSLIDHRNLFVDRTYREE